MHYSTAIKNPAMLGGYEDSSFSNTRVLFLRRTTRSERKEGWETPASEDQ